MERMVYYVGIDGGGSKTAAIIANADGSIVRTTLQGPGNITLLGVDGTRQLVRAVLSDLLADQPVSSIAAITFAFAGAGRLKAAGDVHFDQLMNEFGICRYTLKSDSESLHYSIFGDGNGILMLSGTGSICRFRADDGVLRKVGGWGYLLGDEGSGFDIGRQAIRHAVMEADLGKPPGALTIALLAQYQVNQPNDLIVSIYGKAQPQQLIASCARTVQRLAQEGNAEASKILSNAAKSLLRMVKRAISSIKRQDVYQIGAVGGALKPGSPLLKAFCQAVEDAGLSIELVSPEMSPAAAAVLMAASAHRGEIDPRLQEAMKNVYFD